MAIVSGRTQQLQGLQQAMPVANQRIAQGMKAAQNVQLQQQLGGARPQPMPANRAAVQQLGAQQAGQQGASALGLAEQQQKQQAALGQQANQEQQRQNQQALASKQRSLQQTQRGLEKQIFGLSEELKDKLLDSQLAFKKDELGRTVFNERQLADYAIMKAKSDEDFAAFEQQSTQASQKRMSMLKLAQQKVQQELDQRSRLSDSVADQNTKKNLAIAKQQLERKIADEKTKQRNRAMMFQAGGMLAGAAIGTLIAPGAGTAAGASLGGGAGSIAAGATAE